MVSIFETIALKMANERKKNNPAYCSTVHLQSFIPVFPISSKHIPSTIIIAIIKMARTLPYVRSFRTHFSFFLQHHLNNTITTTSRHFKKQLMRLTLFYWKTSSITVQSQIRRVRPEKFSSFSAVFTYFSFSTNLYHHTL